MEMNENLHNPYDKIIKEIFEKSTLLSKIGNFTIKDRLPKLIFDPKTNKVDSLYLVNDNGIEADKILHVEFQSSNDSMMEERMLEYLTAIRKKYKIPIIQSLFYLGSRPLTMKDAIDEECLKYRYFIVDINDIDFDDLVMSNNSSDVILALLGNLGEKNHIDAIRMVLSQIQRLSNEKSELNRYFEFITLLGRLRKIDYLIRDEVKKIMIDVDYKESVIYQDGFSEGKVEGKIEGESLNNRRIAKAMKMEGDAIEKISRLTGLSQSEIETL